MDSQPFKLAFVHGTNNALMFTRTLNFVLLLY